jgi:hypothetical protein
MHSKRYKDFIIWHSQIGTREGDYHLADNFLDELYDWERDDAERIIYTNLCEDGNAVTYFARYLPKLKNYDGMRALEDYLQISKNHSIYRRTEVASILYNITLNPKYIDVMMDAYRMDHNIRFVATMVGCRPSEALFKALAYIYVNDEDSTNRSAAGDGLLYCKGYMPDLDIFRKPSADEMKIRRLLIVNDIMERAVLTEKLWQGVPLIDGHPVPESLY